MRLFWIKIIKIYYLTNYSKKKKKKNSYLVRIYLFTYNRYLPIPSRSHSTPTNEQTNENVKQDIEADKRDEPKEG